MLWWRNAKERPGKTEEQVGFPSNVSNSLTENVVLPTIENKMNVNRPLASRTAIEWRKRFADSKSVEEVDGEHDTQVHFRRVEKLLARFQAKKGKAEVKAKSDPQISEAHNNNVMIDSKAHTSKVNDIPLVTCYLSKPPILVKWKGLGLVPAEQTDKVDLLRPKVTAKEKLGKFYVESRPIGVLTLNLIEAKGLPRNELIQNIHAFAEVKLYPTEQVSR